MSLLENLPHTADIGRVSYVQDQDGLGGETEVTGSPYAADEPAWFQPLSASQINLFSSRQQDVTHRVYLQRDPGLRLDDRLLAKDGNITCPWTGKYFTFVAWDEATAGLGLLWKAIVKLEQEP